MDNASQNQGTEHAPVSIGNWVITLLLASIPVVNIVCALVWAFSGATHPSKANFAKALLVWFALAILFAFMLAPQMASQFASLSQGF